VPTATERFAKLFSGYENAHGVHLYSEEVEENGKRKGKSFTKDEAVSLQLYQDHLDGKQGLGIIPITKDGLVNFAVIDIDEYKQDLGLFRRLVYDRALPMHPFTSKSGGLHLYCFFSKPEPAKAVVEFMHQVVSIFGLPKDTEVFPKQVKMSEGDRGNWINLPYYNMGQKQYLQDRRGVNMSLEEALSRIEANLTTLKDLTTAFDNLPASDGPPCMQAIMLRGSTDNRNNFFFSYGVYMKAKHGEDYVQPLLDANSQLDQPLQESELRSTVVKSLDKGTYAYKCKQGPIMDYCNRELCKRRPFGIQSGFIAGIDFGSLTQVKTDPPHYIWTVGGVRMRFESEQDILKQDKFRALCFRDLHTLPQRVKDETWTAVLQRALDNIEVEEVSEDDLSEGALLWVYVEEYLVDRSHAGSIGGVAMNQVYIDTIKGEFCFKGSHLLKFLKDTKGMKDIKNNALHDTLKQAGAQFVREWTSKTQQVRMIRLPFAAVNYDHDKSTAEKTELVDFGDMKREEWE